MTVLPITAIEPLLVQGHDGHREHYLRLTTDGGVTGFYGPIDAEAARVVDLDLRPHVLGQDALGHGALWERMYRADRHSRGSHWLMGMSAIDNALWDLRGRLFGQPVYRLLGGTRHEVSCYASCLGLSQEPDALQAKAQALAAEGYQHQKWFVRDRGPEQGPAGVSRDVEVVRLAREAVGDDVDLMFDAFWAWDLPYALDWARRAEPYRPRWIEEPFQSSELDAFVALSRATHIPVATGEHFYGRWDAHRYLQAGAIKVVQADPEWCGGVSELSRIATVAGLYGAQLVPHGHGLHAALHVVASQALRVCPLVEYLLQHMPWKHEFELDPPQPRHGVITVSDEPGFGIELDERKVAELRCVAWREE